MHDTHAVAIKREQDGETVIVGHVPLTHSRTFHLFLKHGGKSQSKSQEKEETKASAWKFRLPTDLSTISRLKCQSLFP